MFSSGWSLVLVARAADPLRVERRLGGRWLYTFSSPRCLVTFFLHSWCFVTALFTLATCPQLNCSVCLLSKTRSVQER